MITSPTTFILGAGASMPYGFPSGAQLKVWICQATENEDWISRELHEKLDIDPQEIKEFARTLRRSHINSVDAFLFRRPEFNRIGKFAIAAHICRLEIADRLDSTVDRENWYRFLWNKMVTDTRNANDVIQNQVRFVSFNYDRSLERFLFGAAKHTYGLSDEEAYRVSQSISIIHVYGQVGTFHYVGDQGERRSYNEQLTANILRVAANGIRLIPEERGDNHQFQLARTWYDWAEKVCFLGFGFDTTNCENLGLVSVLDWKSNKSRPLPSIFASTLNLTHTETEQARRQVCGEHEWTYLSADNVMTLRNLDVFA